MTRAAHEDQLLKSLIREHRKRKDEPLHLAIQFEHARHKRDLCLFEVLGNFGSGSIHEDKKSFEVAFAAASVGSRLSSRDALRLVLTSPEELREALRAGWASLAPIKKAFADDAATVLFSDSIGKRLLADLQHGAANAKKRRIA